MSDLELHVDQLILSLNNLKEADERRDPVDTWNHSKEDLAERREMYEFRKLQVTERAKYLIKMLEEE